MVDWLAIVFGTAVRRDAADPHDVAEVGPNVGADIQRLFRLQMAHLAPHTGARHRTLVAPRLPNSMAGDGCHRIFESRSHAISERTGSS